MTIQWRIHVRSGILGAYLIMNKSGRHDQTPQTACMGCKWFSVKEFDTDESLVWNTRELYTTARSAHNI